MVPPETQARLKLKNQAYSDMLEGIMTVGKIETNEYLLMKLSTKCKVFYNIFRALFIVSITVWVALMAFTALKVFVVSQDQEMWLQGLPVFISLFLFGAVFTSILRILNLVFKSIYLGKPPFSAKNIKRVKLIALLVFLYATIDVASSVGFSSLIQLGGHTINYGILETGNEPMMSIDLGTFATSVFIYSLAVVFEYGTELQQQSDNFI